MICICHVITTLSLVSLSTSIPVKHERQRSPIALDTVDAEEISARDALLFEYPDVGVARSLRHHHGHFEIVMNEDVERVQKLTVSHLGNDSFVLRQFHIHWGDSVDDYGSEHSIDGRRSTAEIHFVHRNIKYRSIREALGKPNGIVVLAVMIESIDNDLQVDHLISNIDDHASDQLSLLRQLLINGNSQGDRLRYLDQIRPKLLIPDSSHFLHYSGSLTFNERGPVEWILFERPLRVSRRQLNFLYEYGPANYNVIHEIRSDTVIYRTVEGSDLDPTQDTVIYRTLEGSGVNPSGNEEAYDT